MRQALFLVGVIASLLGAMRPAAADLSITSGESALLQAFPAIQKTDFSGAPQSAILATTPGGFHGVTYYRELVFKGMRIYQIYSDSSNPGLSRTANWCAFPEYPALCSFYNPRGDAIYSHAFVIDFRAVGGSNGIGFRFGSLDDPSPCCVRQYMTVYFTDGSFTKVELVATLGFERGYNDFTSIISNGLPITHVEIVQVGHTPIIDDVTWAPATPRIYFAGNDVTGTTPTTVVTGQLIALIANSAASSKSMQWEISGNPIANYKITSTSGAVIALTADDKKRNTMNFYWNAPGIYTVNYLYKLADGTSGRVGAVFKVNGPNGGILTFKGKVQIIDNRRGSFSGRYKKTFYLGCGNTKSTDFVCMKFDRAKTKGPAGESGKFLWAQTLMQYVHTHISIDGSKIVCGRNVKHMLDNRYPYPNQKPTYTTDSPAIEIIKSDNWISANFRARMYLMWKSDRTGSIPVSIGYTEWSWSGIASRVGDSWKLNKAPAPTAKYYPTTGQPVWSGVHISGQASDCM